MSDPIKAGMYKSEGGEPARITLDHRFTKVRLHSGEYIEVVDPQYVVLLERQILELSKNLDTHKDKLNKHDAEFKKLAAAIRKLGNHLL